LFDAIQQGDWDGANNFLEAGTFTFSPFPTDDGEIPGASKDQAETWVECRNERRKLVWRQLPIHAAICRGAPFKTVQMLVKVYPDSLCCADIESNLPLHLAIKFKGSEKLILLLLKSHPEALQAKNGQGDTPLMCVTAANDTGAITDGSRYRLFQSFVECGRVLKNMELDRQEGELQSLVNSKDRAAEELARTKKKVPAWRTPPIRTSSGLRDRFCGYWRKREGCNRNS